MAILRILAVRAPEEGPDDAGALDGAKRQLQRPHHGLVLVAHQRDDVRRKRVPVERALLQSITSRQINQAVVIVRARQPPRVRMGTLHQPHAIEQRRPGLQLSRRRKDALDRGNQSVTFTKPKTAKRVGPAQRRRHYCRHRRRSSANQPPDGQAGRQINSPADAESSQTHPASRDAPPAN